MQTITIAYLIGAVAMLFGIPPCLLLLGEETEGRFGVLLGIPGFAAVAYGLMALGVGVVEFQGFEVSVLRYVDWLVTTPLLVGYTAYVAGFGRQGIAGLVVIDALMIVFGAAAVALAPPLQWEVSSPRRNEFGDLYNAVDELRRSLRSRIEEANQRQAKAKEVKEETERLAAQQKQEKQVLAEHVDRLLAAMHQFAEGDLTVQVDPNTEGDVGRLYEGFNRAVARMRETLGQVAEAISTASSTAKQVRASVEQLSAGAEKQSSQAEEVGVAMEAGQERSPLASSWRRRPARRLRRSWRGPRGSAIGSTRSRLQPSSSPLLASRSPETSSRSRRRLRKTRGRPTTLQRQSKRWRRRAATHGGSSSSLRSEARCDQQAEKKRPTRRHQEKIWRTDGSRRQAKGRRQTTGLRVSRVLVSRGERDCRPCPWRRNLVER